MFERLVVCFFGAVVLLACEPLPKGERPPPPPVSARSVVALAPVRPTPEPPVVNAVAAASTAPSSRCNEQKPQPFLVDAHFDSFFAAGGKPSDWKRVLDEAVRYRTEQYGYVKGYGKRAWNASTPTDQAELVTFFGVSVSLHRRVAPALSCVETAIRESCTKEPYQPYVLSGLRKRNTYVSGEISNHVYGIALDVDPLRNPCCGCIGSWGKSERCQNEKNKFQRMEMPRCWVTQFERFGFYWLGHDKIEDTMHFEFLGDPSQVLRQPELVR